MNTRGGAAGLLDRTKKAAAENMGHGNPGGQEPGLTWPHVRAPQLRPTSVMMGCVCVMVHFRRSESQGKLWPMMGGGG